MLWFGEWEGEGLKGERGEMRVEGREGGGCMHDCNVNIPMYYSAYIYIISGHFQPIGCIEKCALDRVLHT